MLGNTKIRNGSSSSIKRSDNDAEGVGSQLKKETLSKLNKMNIFNSDDVAGNDIDQYYPGMYADLAKSKGNVEKQVNEEEPAWLSPLYLKAALQQKSRPKSVASSSVNSVGQASPRLSPTEMSEMAKAATRILRSSNSHYALDVPADIQRYSRSSSVSSRCSGDQRYNISPGTVRKIPRKSNARGVVSATRKTRPTPKPITKTSPSSKMTESPNQSRSMDLIDKISSALSSGSRLSGQDAEELLAFLPELRSLKTDNEKPPFVVDTAYLKKTALTMEKTKTGLRNHLALQKKLALEDDERDAYDRRLLSAVRKAALEKQRKIEEEEMKRRKRQGKFAHVKSRYMQSREESQLNNSSSISSKALSKSNVKKGFSSTSTRHLRGTSRSKGPHPTMHLKSKQGVSEGNTNQENMAVQDELVDLLEQLVVVNQMGVDRENTSMDEGLLSNVKLDSNQSLNEIVDQLYNTLKEQDESRCQLEEKYKEELSVIGDD